MKTVIAYPIPLENPEVRDRFLSFVKRFTDSLRQHDPGCEYELNLILNGGDVDAFKEIAHLFVDLPVKFEPQGRFLDFERLRFIRYSGGGADVGSFIHCAMAQKEETFLVCCNTRVYAHRRGWLATLSDARQMFGKGLYATSISREGGRLHACCRCFGIDSELLARYPYAVTSRDQGQFFESGVGNLLEWVWRCGVGSTVVYHNGVNDIGDSKGMECWIAENIYRRGNQSNCLVFDRHTDAYRDASEEEKKRLEAMCFGH